MRSTSSIAILLIASAAWAGGDYEAARLEAGANARDLAVSSQVEQILRQKEAQVGVKRREGIGLLETFLREHQPTAETPEVIFQLAELRWEEAKASFLSEMAAYNTAVEKCSNNKDTEKKEVEKPKRRGAIRLAEPERCKLPSQPQLELVSSQKLYLQLINEYPSFRKIDAVLYLLGFSLRSQG